MESSFDDFKDDIKDFDVYLKLCKEFIRQSLLRYCNKDETVESDAFKDIDSLEMNDDDIQNFVRMLATSYDVVDGLIDIINPSVRISDSTFRKTKVLLQTMEASLISNEIRG